MSNQLDTVLLEGLKKSGVPQEKIQKVLQNPSNVQSLINTSKLNEIQSQASQAINASLSSLTSNLSSFGSLFSSNPLTGILTSTKGDAAKGPKEADSKIKSLASDASAAIATPVAFISKPIADTIKGIDTLSQGTGLKDYLSSMNSTELSNLAKSIGSPITSSDGVLNSIIQTTNSLADTFKQIPDSLSSMKNAVLAPIASTIDSFTGTLKSGIGNLLTSVSGSTGLSDLISAGSNLTNSVLSLLPNSLSKYIQASSTAFLESTLNSLVGNKLDSFNHILSLLSGNFSSETLLSKLLGLGDSSNYPNTITSSTNNSSTSASITNSLYGAAKTICAKVSTPRSTSFQINKDLYDLLMDMAADFGLSDLIRQLANCTSAFDDITGKSRRSPEEDVRPYMDERTVMLLQSKTRSIAMRGDTETYKTVQDVITVPQIKELKKDMIVLTANMQATDKNITNYDAILAQNLLTKESLIYADDIATNKVINGPVTAAMCATDTTIVDSVLTPEVRALTQGAIYAYA